MSLRQDADSLFGRATDAGDVPGVVAMAINRDGTLFEGHWTGACPGCMDRLNDEALTSAGEPLKGD